MMKNFTLVLIILCSLLSGQRRVEKIENRIPGHVFSFNFKEFEDRISEQLKSNPKIIKGNIVLPVEGKNVKFLISENTCTQERLQNILTFDGISEDGKASIKLSVFNHTINATVKTQTGLFYIEPYKTNKGELRIYDAGSDFGEVFRCGVKDDHTLMKDVQLSQQKLSVTNFPYGNQLKKYRLAVATTGESIASAGNQDNALVRAVNMVNMINQAFESEISVTFTVVVETTNKTLIFTNAATDPFSGFPNDESARSQAGFTTLHSNGTLPYSHYDVGHTFNITTDTGGADGIAGPGPCNDTQKARAWSNFSYAGSLGFAANITIHEIAHQFGAYHTFNATGGTSSQPTFCTEQWSNGSAVEPGSGTSRMSYPTNCIVPVSQVNNANRVFYFNARSLDQMLARMQTAGNCYSIQATSNIPPVADAGADVSIPKNTPFKLKGTGSDANDTNLSYTWEQADIATANDKGALGATIAGAGGYTAVNGTTTPLFRTDQSLYTTERYFPSMKFILNNQNNTVARDAEALPMVARTMKFRFTVRDNHPSNVGVDSDDINVTVTNDGPLSVTYPNAAGLTFNAGSTVNVQWAVNGTNNIRDKVNILLSADGGNTFPYVLASNIDNNGAHSTALPNIPNTTSARIKIVAVLNPFAEFFDVSDHNFTISSSCIAYASYVTPDTAVSAVPGSTAANLNMTVPPAAFDSYLSKTFTYNVQNTNNNIIIYSDSSMTVPAVLINNDGSRTIKFRVTKTGAYRFDTSNGLIISIHTGTPANTGNFLSSNSYYSGGGFSSNSSTVTVNLTAGIDYYMVNSDYSYPPSSTVYTFNLVGAGSMYEMYSTPSGYTYTYAAVNNATGKIAAVSTTANFMALPLGQYTVKGISYISTITDPTVFIGKNFTEMRTSGYCFYESMNERRLTIATALGIAENIKDDGIKIAPNPVTDLLTIITDRKITDYSIYDMSGKLVRKSKFTPEVNFKEFVKGAYILLLYENSSLIYKTTVIKK